MKVIGAGFGRSGTMSIRQALEVLGYGPCYHMRTALWRFWHLNFFLKAWHGKKVDWKRFFRNYHSVVDWPACAFYRDLMLMYPEARILLNVRDPEKWYDSMHETIWAIHSAFPWWFPPAVRKLHDEIIWSGSLKGTFPDRDSAIRIYKKYIEEVREKVPSNRLLVYDVSEGWTPLCSFLGVPVPENKPFPVKNDRKSFRRLIVLLKVLEWLLPVMLAGIVLLILTILF